MATATDGIIETIDKIVTVLRADATIAAQYTTIGKLVPPKLIPPLMATEYPAICISGINSPEEWESSHRREQIHTIELYVMNQYMVQQTDIRKLFEKAKYLADAIRGERLASNYLSKPIDIVGFDYDTLEYGDDNRQWQFVATITIECRRLFIGT